MKSNEINAFYYMKAFAIFSVICAHITPLNENVGLLSKFISNFYDCLGCLGVGIFFIISGYLFYNNKYPLKEFLLEKFKKIIIPWFFIGSIVYICVFYFQQKLSLIEYIKFLFGYGSYLYYLSVLFIFYLLFFSSKMKKIKILIVLFIMSIVSNIITINYYDKLDHISYINALNWMIYFIIGIVLNKYRKIDIIKERFHISYILVLLIVLIHLFFSEKLSYFSPFGLITIILSFFSLLSLLLRKDINNKFLKYIGKISFSIYLIHMPIAGVIVRLSNLFDIPIIIIIRPFVTLLITVFVIWIYKKILDILGAPKILYNLIGLKKGVKVI